MSDDPYELRWTRAAHRAIAEELSEAVATAAIALITGDLSREPRRVGRELHKPLEGHWSARRATYRVIYTIDDDKHQITIKTIEHRRDAYRPR